MYRRFLSLKHFKKLIGDRIYLSPISFSEDAVEQFAEWLNDFNVTDYTGRSGKIFTLEQEKEHFEKSCKNTENIYFDIVILKDDKLIGRISLNNIEWIPRGATIISEKEYEVIETDDDGNEVTTKKKADLIFSYDEGITPFDSDVILADYL